MTTRFTSLDSLVPFAKLRARRGTYNGIVSEASRAYLQDICRHLYAYNPEESALIIFSRDTGHHTSGWWKNPDYENCLHLSISYQAQGQHVPHDKSKSQRLAEAFFGDDASLAWIEGPYSPEGKVNDVWHYRVFTDPAWNPFKPRGEVYNNDWTPSDWKSFSEIHGYKPTHDQAPFLLEGQ